LIISKKRKIAFSTLSYFDELCNSCFPTIAIPLFITSVRFMFYVSSKRKSQLYKPSFSVIPFSLSSTVLVSVSIEELHVALQDLFVIKFLFNGR